MSGRYSFSVELDDEDDEDNRLIPINVSTNSTQCHSMKFLYFLQLFV
jgi:hypothetical protein